MGGGGEVKKIFVLLSIVLFVGGCIYGTYTSQPPGAQVYWENWTGENVAVEGCATPCNTVRFNGSKYPHFVQWPDGSRSEQKRFPFWARTWVIPIPKPGRLHFEKERDEPPEEYEDPATKPKYIE